MESRFFRFKLSEAFLFSLFAIFMSAPLSSSFAALADTPWPMFGHDLQHTGRSSYSGPKIPEKKWEYDIGNIGAENISAAVGLDGAVYIGSYIDDRLYAFETDGTVRWYYEIGGHVLSTPAIGTDGVIYVTSDGDFLFAINPNGTLKWKASIPTTSYSSPAIALDGTIYLCGETALYAINPGGGIEWQYAASFPASIRSSAALDSSGTVYFATWTEGCVYAINTNGTLKWKYDPQVDQMWLQSSPAIGSDGTIYIGGYFRNQHLLAINPNGTLKWKYNIGGDVSTPAIAADGTIYVGVKGPSGENCYALALNPNGTLKWTSAECGWSGFNPPAAAIGAYGTIYLGSCGDCGNLYALSPEGGSIWTYDFSQYLYGPSVYIPVLGLTGTIIVIASYVTESWDTTHRIYAIGEKKISEIVLYVNKNDETCGGRNPCYTSIQSAINAASTGASIRISQGTYVETFALNESINLTLQGGWNPAFTSQTSNTTFIKAPKAPQGSLTLQMLTVKPL